VTSFSETEFSQKYNTGKLAFEQGRYRLSIEQLEQACQLISPYSRLGGEAKMWLITAYQAAGESDKAITLCQELSNESYGETKKQASRLLYILNAPQLERPKKWMTEIPDFNSPTSNQYRRVSNSNTKIKPKPQIELVDLSKVNTKENQFIWLSLGIASLTVISLFII